MPWPPPKDSAAIGSTSHQKPTHAEAHAQQDAAAPAQQDVAAPAQLHVAAQHSPGVGVHHVQTASMEHEHFGLRLRLHLRHAAELVVPAPPPHVIDLPQAVHLAPPIRPTAKAWVVAAAGWETEGLHHRLELVRLRLLAALVHLAQRQTESAASVQRDR